jgi:hypothetical protein
MSGERSVAVGRLTDGDDQRRAEAVVAIRQAMAAARRKRVAVVAGLFGLVIAVFLIWDGVSSRRRRW